jgi:hypothetical protein
MDVIRAVVEDSSLGPAEKVLFAILYCRREGDQCGLSVREIVHQVRERLEALDESAHHLLHGGFFNLQEGCDISDATTFLSCAVLGEPVRPKKPQAPRP